MIHVALHVHVLVTIAIDTDSTSWNIGWVVGMHIHVQASYIWMGDPELLPYHDVCVISHNSAQLIYKEWYHHQVVSKTGLYYIRPWPSSLV